MERERERGTIYFLSHFQFQRDRERKREKKREKERKYLEA